MKKILLLSSLCILGALGSFAQRSTNGLNVVSSAPSFVHGNDKAGNDTIFPAIRTGCSDSLFLYTFPAPNKGFVSGTNSFMDKEKAQAILNTTPGFVTHVIAGIAYQTGSGTYSAKVYGLSNDTVVGSQIGSSAAASVSAGLIVVPLSAQVPVSSKFAVSMTVSGAAGDTVAIYTTRFTCGNRESFEMWSDNTWHVMQTAYGQDIDFLLGAVVYRSAAGIDSKLGIFEEVYAYPTISSGEFTIRYATKEAGRVNINITNMSGQNVLSLNEGTKAAGEYNRAVDISNFASGVYVYSIEMNGSRATGRIVVGK
jgi:hypothetical protein